MDPIARAHDRADTRNPAEVAKAYEDGKHRRYNLLFAVNGGAFAVAKVLGGAPPPGDRVLGHLHLADLALGLAVFTVVMTVDIDAFARRMKAGDDALYSPVGVAVLLTIGSLIVAGWMLVGYTPTAAALAVVVHLALVLACRLPAARPEHRRSNPSRTR